MYINNTYIPILVDLVLRGKNVNFSTEQFLLTLDDRYSDCGQDSSN